MTGAKCLSIDQFRKERRNTGFIFINQLDNQWNRMTQSSRYISFAKFKKSIRDMPYDAQYWKDLTVNYNAVLFHQPLGKRKKSKRREYSKGGKKENTDLIYITKHLLGTDKQINK
ncbi:hypothetical protein BpHYR1_024765 [Brachionus plicatilis]|uniref:Uncharacterized protein n=1 Tax=Brachionus plicatilis TaxID=10195 RepID=A0A3M7SI43_BRAPC|nr:hypothetical protein BpHYR1_024765 [Brachionus plicatilis]